jgi:hypothetical protein
VLAYIELAKRYRLDWKAWGGLIIGEFLILFFIDGAPHRLLKACRVRPAWA